MKKSGGKFAPSHTTFIESAEGLVKFANKCELVTKITLGIITPLPKSHGGQW